MPTSAPPALPIRVEARGESFVLVDASGGALPEGEFATEAQAQTVASRINTAWSNLDADARKALKVGEHAIEEVSSHVYPGLERKPGKQNWVDYAGGLPSYIERIAKHIHYEGGRPIGQAIAAAVNTVKRWCSGGSVSKTGGPRVANVNADTKAKACKAVAEWEAKRARGRVSHAAREAVETYGEETLVTLEEAAAIIAAVEGDEIETPEGHADTLRARLDAEIETHRTLMASGDPRAIERQRAVVSELRGQVEEAEKVQKTRVHKDGSPVA